MSTHRRFLGLGALAVLAATLTLTGCSSDESVADPGPAALTGKTYLSTSVTGEQIPGGGPLEVSFPQAGRIAATAGCNRHMGEVTFEGSTMTPGQLAATMLACPGPQEGADAWLSNLLSGPLTWSTTGDRLTLHRGGQTVELQRRPDTALVGTDWTVQSIVHAQGIESSRVIEDIRPRLTLSADGTVAGFAGCNDFHGDAVINGDKIEFRGISGTRKMCDEEITRVEKNVMDTLRGTVSYTIEGKALTLTNDADPTTGLRLTAP
ncbi:hypothetical protein GOHSU_02_01880 [Gordonia hirsuta DSM 44140 = NBRC 16056]|uniref:DUF306 domain-containing protein n=1 Tax=Gordonia hirsuta DSM 44140 = NBRC 16056 TaxID=1121927 RepID=L7L5M9_9ACTN|nr:META domain-containing protein [Gordonia hirsuta]GAC56041.1 hypothetical protein GOHSU_02_01880 [Gordonia hirsuta DSM 44140 = NBRC 16056]